jgi:dihydroorotate dehydrogenase (fumarate)
MSNLKTTLENPGLNINPPLLNSASPWATTVDDLRELYNCPYTGAITIRTSLLNGFPHDPSIHQYMFFSTSIGSATARVSEDGSSEVLLNEDNSLNTLGYSPIPLQKYLMWIGQAYSGEIPDFRPTAGKPIIVSVTGSAEEVASCYSFISYLQKQTSLRLMMEINLSCPNIPDKSPPAYEEESLVAYLVALAKERVIFGGVVLAGVKTPPYTYQGQFNALITALKTSTKFAGGCPVSFITATNTLGSCLVLKDGQPALKSSSGEGTGGMAGSSLHPLALGNVSTIRRMLDESEDLKHIEIIGVGGVSDNAGYLRMRNVGAAAVAVGTAFGREGIAVFEKIKG